MVGVSEGGGRMWDNGSGWCWEMEVGVDYWPWARGRAAHGHIGVSV